MSQFRMTNCHLYTTDTGNEGDVRPARLDELFPEVDGQRTCNLDGYMVIPTTFFDADCRRLIDKLRTQNDELTGEAEGDHAKYLKLVEAIGQVVNAKDRTGFQQTAITRLREVYDSLGG